MKIAENLFHKFRSLAYEVKEDLRSRGIVVPVSTHAGVSLGNYTVVKSATGFYSVIDPRNRAVYEKINLPQTALLLANDLALGKAYARSMKSTTYLPCSAAKCRTLAK